MIKHVMSRAWALGVLLALAAAMLVLLLAPPRASAQLPGEDWYKALPRPEWKALTRVQTPADQGWFEVYRLRRNVYAIYEPGEYLQVISYLFVGTKRAMLFDSGLNIGDMQQLTDALTNKPVIVVNSHSDFDHIGGSYEYSRVWAFDDPAGYARYNAQHGVTHDEFVAACMLDPWMFWPAKTLPAHFDPTTYFIPPYTVTRWLKKGDVIDLGGMRFKVYSAPGHSPDTIGLVDREHRLMTVGGIWCRYIPVDDLKAYTATAAKFAELSKQVDYVLPNHIATMEPARVMVRMNHAFKAINSGTATHYVDETYPDDPASNTRWFHSRHFEIAVPWSELGLQ